MEGNKIYHVSESHDIKIFEPRPSPSNYESIKESVVFAISEKLLHNYLLPRDCPRVTFYAGSDSSKSDKEKFFGYTTADFVIVIEKVWIQKVMSTELCIYEFPVADFTLLDEIAGYYISYKSVKPISIRSVPDILNELFKRNIELRIMPEINILADAVSKSSLNFSLIRIRNAKVSK